MLHSVLLCFCMFQQVRKHLQVRYEFLKPTPELRSSWPVSGAAKFPVPVEAKPHRAVPGGAQPRRLRECCPVVRSPRGWCATLLSADGFHGQNSPVRRPTAIVE